MNERNFLANTYFQKKSNFSEITVLIRKYIGLFFYFKETSELEIRPNRNRLNRGIPVLGPKCGNSIFADFRPMGYKLSCCGGLCSR